MDPRRAEGDSRRREPTDQSDCFSADGRPSGWCAEALIYRPLSQSNDSMGAEEKSFQMLQQC